MFWFVFGLGLLMSQYTITGFDASAHMAEETRQASRMAAVGMYMSVVVSVIFGWVLLLAVTFAVPDTQGALDAVGNAVVYIWATSMGQTWAEILLFICVRRADLLPDGVGDVGVTDDVRVLTRPCRARPPALAARSARTACRRNVGLGDRRPLVGADDADDLERFVGYLVGTSIAVIGLYIAFVLPVDPALTGSATSSSRGRGRSASTTSGST